jgi:exodeoxyribonuclease VII large subunit
VEFIPRSIYTVSSLTAEIHDILETNFDEIWVEGEVSNLRIPPSGHSYFTLKDESSQIQAVIFRSQSRFLDFQPEDGLSVICRGRVGVYAQRGQYQLIVSFMEPRGMGRLQLAFDQLKRRLEVEGLFDPSRKKPLPMVPKKIGIVTSPAGAVIRDVLTIIKRRYENVGILVYPVRVQGDGASNEIAEGITFLDRETDVDTILVARGGGSLEDLWAFNEETVARAVAMAEKPVVSAVGHEVDFTICDFVADLRAPTPSAAAELIVKNKADLLGRIVSLRERLIRQVATVLRGSYDRWSGANRRLKDPQRRLVDLRLRGDDLVIRLLGATNRIRGEKQMRFQNTESHLLYRAPRSKVDRLRDRVSQRAGKLDGVVHDFLIRKRRSLERLADRLEGMSPLRILGRGYSILLRIPSKEIVRDARTVRGGDRVEAKLYRGSLICQVEKTKTNS